MLSYAPALALQNNNEPFLGLSTPLTSINFKYQHRSTSQKETLKLRRNQQK